MKQARYPNRLKLLVKDAGLTIREVHQETKIPESTLHYWAAGSGITKRSFWGQIPDHLPVMGCLISREIKCHIFKHRFQY